VVPIVSPIDGIVAARNMSVGQNVDTSQVLARVVNLNRVYIDAQIYEKDIQGVNVGDSVTVHVPAFPERSFAGKVQFVAHEVNLETRRFEKDFFSIDTINIATSVKSLLKKYPRFTPDFVQNILGLDMDSLLIPGNAQDIAVLNFLLVRHQRVSWERLLSGTGIYTIWEYLTEIENKPKPSWLLEQMEHTDKAAAVSKAAIEKTCPVCIEAMAMFNRYLAIEGANIILKLKATGGLYLAGGIAAKNISLLDPAVWAEIFSNSGRMKALLAQVPVFVMTNEKAPLLGSAYYAAFNM
jgi:hypothetical protein